jgi:hypothetical protein
MPTLELPTRHRRHSLEEVDGLGAAVFPEGANRVGDAVRAGIDVGPEPQRRHAEPARGVKRLQRLMPCLLVLRRHRVLQDDQVAAVERRPRADAAVPLEGVEIELGLSEDLVGEIDGRAPGDEHGRRVLAHSDHPFRGAGCGHQVKVGQLGHRVSHLLVDRPGHLAPLHVRHRDVHVGGRSGPQS